MSTVRIRGTSGVTPATPATATTVDCNTPPPMITSSRSSRPTGLALGRKQRGDVLGGLAGDEQDLLDPGEVHRRREHREVEEGGALVLHLHHAADREALRKRRPEAR